MTDTAHDQEVIQGLGEEESPADAFAGDPSLIARLRALREEAKADHHLDLDIPGYEGLLVARFKPYSIAKSEAKANVLRKEMGKKRSVLLQASCDGLIDACDEVLIRKTPDADLQPVDDVTPVRFDSRLAELLGIQATTAREVVVGLFPTEQSILAMNVAVSEWLQDVTRDVDEDLLGE